MDIYLRLFTSLAVFTQGFMIATNQQQPATNKLANEEAREYLSYMATALGLEFECLWP
jgi:hypothetical protein